ncbi:hypothetical protein GF337_05005 [candidate division KSB1 bacterium]|nr:hypothetical protein [candidate division KSB1 bacterium]
MKKITAAFVVLWFILSNLSFVNAEVEKSERIEETFRFSDRQTKSIIVDNVFGSIRVTGSNENEARLVVNRTVRASGQEKYERALEEIYLDIEHENNSLILYVEGPFRCKDGSTNYRGWRFYGYEVQYDIELEIPMRSNVQLKTVNDGDIHVRNINGQYEIENINGGIKINDLAGSGRVYALNGDVEIAFSENPAANSYFGTLNGDLNLYFRTPLSADIFLKTFNGDVYSDFEVSYLPKKTKMEPEKQGKKTVYKFDRRFAVQAGDGGPEIELDTFNGDIHIFQRKS